VISLGTPQLDQIAPGDKRLDEQAEHQASSWNLMRSVTVGDGF
jgi:hypothetical protein